MLGADDFTPFFTELHGYPPFRWQERLARQVADTGRWPDSISVPTGYGKTSVIEIALFALAVNPALPRRTVLVVDRRLVVDHAYDTARRLESALRSPGTRGPTVARVAKKLGELGGESPLATAILRGGMYRESTWVRNPAQPMIICSTVDQVGSRLLHRGYDVSERMRSVHAGFLAHDTVCILDEAHIAEPFRQTVGAVQAFAGIAPVTLPRPITLVTMSATLTSDTASGEAFTLTTGDADDPRLAQRRRARKTVTLVKASEENMANRIAREATRLGGTGRTILVVVNRVRRAREVAL
ncbi:MAG: type I-U CRISPR-associated helicase/endonuclease Cas3, partial [Spirochaetaceae bacterium]